MSVAGAVFFWTNKDVLVKEVDKIVERVALEVQRSAKVYAPVDTGTLQGSITSQRETSTEQVVSFLVGTNIHYAAHQEFGTSRMAAHPYLGPAIAEIGAKYG